MKSPEGLEKLKNLTKRQILTVDEHWIGHPLYAFALEHHPEWGKEVVYKLVRSGHIYRMNNQSGKKVFGAAGDRIERNQLVIVPETLPIGMERFVPQPNEGSAKHEVTFNPRVRALAENWVLFKNQHVIVLNKPPGIPMQPPPDKSINIHDMLGLWKYTKTCMPVPAHSLDQETSGCLVLARTPSTLRMLHHSFLRKSVPNQCYWALLTATPKAKCGRIKMHIEFEHQRQAGSGERIVVRPVPTEKSKPSILEYTVNEKLGDYGAWVSFYPMTSVRNQIRIAAAHALKCPIMGDAKYGGEAAYPKNLRSIWNPEDKGISLHLHHRRVQLPYKNPNGDWYVIDAPLHPHMKKSWESIGWNIDALDPFVM
ncbi:pseudouridylate synthase-like protein [Perkinsela sp. CCAP 1560/4]|nr:pseudouridylate synthase-like protein [Perkinsela sp. CCAP 1560/4]|eukprot:KNH05543.1 pseudouridylate synthase-like protein [Perkinsela sp. CCAP 1560/4]